MNNDDTAFNTDLFVLIDPQLAQQVADFPIGFKGLNNVRITRNAAKKLVDKSKSSEIRSLLYHWQDLQMTPIKDVKKWNPHYARIEQKITENSDYRVFIKRFKYYINELEDNQAQINRVYYKDLKDSGGA